MDAPKKRPGRPRGSQDLANFIRASARRAMEQSEKEGKSLADLLKVEMQARPLDFIRAISAYTPKEIDISDDRDVSEMSEREIDERINRLSAALEERLGSLAEGEAGQGPDQESPGVAGKLH